MQRLKHHLQKKAPKTVNNVLTVLNSMLKKAVDWNVIDAVPCQIRLLRTTPGHVDFYDFGEFDRLVQAAAGIGTTEQVIILLAGEAGLRAGEMRALRWSDVNLDGRQVCVARDEWQGHITTTKGGRLRHVPLTRRLTDVLRAHRHLRGPLVLYRDDGTAMTESAVREAVGRVARAAEVRRGDRTC